MAAAPPAAAKPPSPPLSPKSEPFGREGREPGKGPEKPSDVPAESKPATRPAIDLDDDEEALGPAVAGLPPDEHTLDLRHQLGKALRRMRERAGLTRQGLAAKAGVTPWKIDRAEVGRTVAIGTIEFYQEVCNDRLVFLLGSERPLEDPVYLSDFRRMNQRVDELQRELHEVKVELGRTRGQLIGSQRLLKGLWAAGVRW